MTTRLHSTGTTGCYASPDYRYMAGPLGDGRWALDYFPTTPFGPGAVPCKSMIAADLAHANQLLDWIEWAELIGARSRGRHSRRRRQVHPRETPSHERTEQRSA